MALTASPVQDGSCNGLQHYSALARDLGGAKVVNLLPSSTPQDVYSAVATVVERQVRDDAARQRSEAVKLLARNNDRVDRKLIKQSVMTSVYGVTFVGVREQISSRLYERGWNNETEVYTVSCDKSSQGVVIRTLLGCSNMQPG